MKKFRGKHKESKKEKKEKNLKVDKEEKSSKKSIVSPKNENSPKLEKIFSSSMDNIDEEKKLIAHSVYKPKKRITHSQSENGSINTFSTEKRNDYHQQHRHIHREKELRQDLATREWVIIAPERLKGKPLQEYPNPLRTHRADYSENCPFCIGNEKKYPHEEIDIFPLNGSSGNWLVRCIENKYKIFEYFDVCPLEPTEFEVDGIYRKAQTCGHHELVLESPKHNTDMALMTDDELLLIFQMYLKRFIAMDEHPNNLLTVIFKNHGNASGASQPHSHSQIIGLRVVPNFIRHQVGEAQRYFDVIGTCVFCKIIHYERTHPERLVYQNKNFVSFVPFAAESPYQVAIYPKIHQPMFSDIQEDEMIDLVDCFRKTMLALYITLSNPDFNMLFVNAPYQYQDAHYWHWHIKIVPKVQVTAGFEYGTRMNVNVVLPEESAHELRKVDVSLPAEELIKQKEKEVRKAKK